jgi:hypothetical protein
MNTPPVFWKLDAPQGLAGDEFEGKAMHHSIQTNDSTGLQLLSISFDWRNVSECTTVTFSIDGEGKTWSCSFAVPVRFGRTRRALMAGNL